MNFELKIFRNNSGLASSTHTEIFAITLLYCDRSATTSHRYSHIFLSKGASFAAGTVGLLDAMGYFALGRLYPIRYCKQISCNAISEYQHEESRKQEKYIWVTVHGDCR